MPLFPLPIRKLSCLGRRQITTLAGMQFAALKNSLCMPHNPYSPVTLFIMERMGDTGKEDIGAFLEEWAVLPPNHRQALFTKSERICIEYYQCLAVCVNDRQRLAKEIVLRHSEPTFHRLGMEQQAFLDALPVYRKEGDPAEYFDQVSRYVNGMNIKEIDHEDKK